MHAVWIKARTVLQVAPVVQLVDLEQISPPNPQGLTIGPEGPMWVDPEELWWMVPLLELRPDAVRRRA